jgi:DNA-binding CsgD family transcriptional regulator
VGLAYYEAISRYRGALLDWNLVDSELARLAANAGRWGDADRHFADARQLCEANNLRPFLATLFLTRGVALLKRGGLRREALALIDEAKVLCQDLDMGYTLSKVRLVYDAPRRGRPAADGPAGLTQREETVLELLRQGKSNRQIARDMYVSERTVESHLTNIYAKIGVSNRGGAIVWADKNLS